MPPRAAAAARTDPFPGFNFIVEIDGIAAAGFSEVSGLSLQVPVIEYREGNSLATRKLPGLQKVGNIILKRGVTADLSLFQWIRSIADGTMSRRSVSVILLDEARQPVTRWNLSRAWPTKWEGPALNARGNEVAIETLELTCEGIQSE